MTPGDLVVGVPMSQCTFGSHAPLDARPEMVGKAYRIKDVEPWWDGRLNLIFEVIGGDYCGGCFRKVEHVPPVAEKIGEMV